MSKENKEKNVSEETVTETASEETVVSKEEELTQKLKDSEEKYLRMAAEYDNYKKRTHQSITDHLE